jgi:hypothetical protein
MVETGWADSAFADGLTGLYDWLACGVAICGAIRTSSAAKSRSRGGLIRSRFVTKSAADQAVPVFPSGIPLPQDSFGVS